MVISRSDIQSTVRVVISNECFYFGQKTANTFPKKKKTSNTFLSLCFYWLLFNLFWTSKLNFIFTKYCFPIWKWCLQMVLPAQPTLNLDGKFSLLIIKIISWIIRNKLFNRQIFSLGDWFRHVCRISSFCNVENIKQDTKLFIPYQDIELHSRRDCVGKR